MLSIKKEGTNVVPFVKKKERGEEEKGEIRRAYYVQGKSQRQIAQEGGRYRKTVRKIVEEGGKERREGRRGRRRGSDGQSVPGKGVYEPYRERVEELLRENERLPAKQRYTAARIYEVMNMMRKGQVQGVAKGDVRGQVALVAKLFGIAI